MSNISRPQVHLAMLNKSESAVKLGELTTVPIGFAVDVAMNLIKQSQLDLLKRLEKQQIKSGFFVPPTIPLDAIMHERERIERGE